MKNILLLLIMLSIFDVCGQIQVAKAEHDPKTGACWKINGIAGSICKQVWGEYGTRSTNFGMFYNQEVLGYAIDSVLICREFEWLLDFFDHQTGKGNENYGYAPEGSIVLFFRGKKYLVECGNLICDIVHDCGQSFNQSVQVDTVYVYPPLEEDDGLEWDDDSDLETGLDEDIPDFDLTSPQTVYSGEDYTIQKDKNGNYRALAIVGGAVVLGTAAYLIWKATQGGGPVIADAPIGDPNHTTGDGSGNGDPIGDPNHTGDGTGMPTQGFLGGFIKATKAVFQ